ncbi:MAG TPA: sugar phosphate isomerase/epimerase family protein [Planctomycetota bacterium]|nr:sugar phosphate isomerase/epimerase family protein [Planctomycetota bacterium]
MSADLRIGISSGHFEWTDLEHAFRRCRSEWGFDVLEIWSEQIGFPPDKETCRQLAALSTQYGVALGYHAPFVGDYDLAQKDPSRSGLVLRELVGIARRIHAEFLVVHLGSNPDRGSGLRCAMSALSQNRSLVEKHRLRVAVEVVPRIWGSQVGDELADFELLFRTIDQPWLGLNLDYGHAQINGHLDQLIHRLGHKIIYAHVQDTRGDLDEHLGYGMGTVDWERALAQTLATGFRGPFVIEFPEFHGREPVERLVADLRRLAGAGNG